MAAVYQAADTSIQGVNWAVKEMSDANLATPEERAYAFQCFQQEARLLSRLSHVNLPRVIDFFVENQKHYLVMEFVYGKTLEKQFNERMQPFGEDEVLPWALQLCDVLAYLHSQNPPVIFRDLKPGNIMLTPAGQIKLIDFGIVRFFKPGKAKDTQALGTPGYTAPEAHGGQTDARSDIYSLCAMLHQLLTGHDPATTIWNIPPVRQVNSSVSPQMEQILMRGLQLQREKRWGSALELRRALEGLRAGAQPLPRTLVQPQPQMIGQPASVAKPVKASRPTTRLLMAAAELSPSQLALITGGLLVSLVTLTWLLAPLLDQIPFDWNNLPVMALFGALGYAAYPRRGAILAAHGLLTVAMVATVWARVGGSYGTDLLLISTLVSGGLMELWVSVLPKLKRARPGDAWRLELGWLAAMEVLGMVVFFGLLTGGQYGLLPAQWVFSALFGAAGWFVGDSIQKYLYYRKTGDWPSD